MNEDDYYTVMVFQRKKDIPDLRKSTVCIFQDVDKLKYIRRKIGLYKSIAKNNKARVYVSINPRNIKTTTKDLIFSLINAIDGFNNNEEPSLQKKLFSSLMKCPKRDNKKFLIDIDTQDKYVVGAVCAEFSEKTLIKTKNGWHLIVPAQDLRFLEGMNNIEIKKDGMTDISYVEE